VTVIIPTHNRALTIERSIDSILEQLHKEVEIIVIDDNSEDNTEEIITSYRESRIIYLRNETNIGAQGSRIRGMKIANGTYVAFLDSDDELTENSITSRISALKLSGYSDALVYGRFLFRSKKDVESNFERINGNAYKRILKNLSLCGYPAILVTKNCIDVAGFPSPEFPSWQDDDFVLTIAKHFPVVYCDEVVAVIYQSDKSIVKNPQIVILGCQMITRKYRNEIVKSLGLHYVLLWKIRLVRLRLLQEVSIRQYANSIDVVILRAFLRVVNWILKPFFTRIFT